MMKYLRAVIAVIFLLYGHILNAQNDSIAAPKLTISGFADIFYAYDFVEPRGSQSQSFFYNHNRHNEFNLNLGLIQFQVDHPRYRANLALQTGTYAIDNYAAEPDVLKNIFEANVGVALNEQQSIWLDAGILPSYIGFESAISMDNMTLTRSIMAENSPYFVTGAKLTITPNEKWTAAALVMNGWQVIQRAQGNALPSFGTQLTFTPDEETTYNWSTFVGNNFPEEERRMRYFSNLFGRWQLNKNFSLIAGFDIGVEQEAKESTDYNTWLGAALIGQVTINDKWQMALRGELYQDEAGTIVPAFALPDRVTAFSWNLDYLPVAAVVCRLEARLLSTNDEFFIDNRPEISLTNQNFFLVTSIAYRFSKDVR